MPGRDRASRSLRISRARPSAYGTAGNEYPFLSWMSKLGYKTDGLANGIKIIKQRLQRRIRFCRRQADCVSTMTYNEYWQVIDGGLQAEPIGGVQI